MEIETPADVNAIPADAQTTATGLASNVLQAGTGTESPAAADTVTVHYSGWTTDGQLFDSSVQRGQPTSFPLNRVIKGWTEGLQLMVAGEKRRFWIPAELAYGENAGGGRPSGLLVFDVELLEIQKAPEAPKTPEDVAGIPDNDVVGELDRRRYIVLEAVNKQPTTTVDKAPDTSGSCNQRVQLSSRQQAAKRRSNPDGRIS